MRTYPAHLEKRVTLRDGSAVRIRPIRKTDTAIEQEFVRALSSESRYFRFMDALRELSPQMLAHFTRVDYDRHLALIAVTGEEGRETLVGVARYVAGADDSQAEFAVVVADAWQHRGLGRQLMEALMAAARAAGIRKMVGEVLASNHRMLQLAGKLGYRARFDGPDPGMVRVEKDL